MSKRPFLLQYDSPNIVIVPTVSFSPPRKKPKLIETSTICPNTEPSHEKLPVNQNQTEVMNTNQSTVSEIAPIKQGKSSIAKATRDPEVFSKKVGGSWASNYLNSIGQNYKIPLKLNLLKNKYKESTDVNSSCQATNITEENRKSKNTSAMDKTQITKVVKPDNSVTSVSNKNNKKYPDVLQSIPDKDKSKNKIKLNCNERKDLVKSNKVQKPEITKKFDNKTAAIRKKIIDTPKYLKHKPATSYLQDVSRNLNERYMDDVSKKNKMSHQYESATKPRNKSVKETTQSNKIKTTIVAEKPPVKKSATFCNNKYSLENHKPKHAKNKNDESEKDSDSSTPKKVKKSIKSKKIKGEKNVDDSRKRISRCNVSSKSEKDTKTNVKSKILKLNSPKAVPATRTSQQCTGLLPSSPTSSLKSVVQVKENLKNHIQSIVKDYDLRKKLSRRGLSHYFSQLNNSNLKTKMEHVNKNRDNLIVTVENEFKDRVKNSKTSKTLCNKSTEKNVKYKKVKLVIKVMCEDSNSSSDADEDNSEIDNCDNQDLSFLDDLNIDEIVESLNNCNKKSEEKNNEHFDKTTIPAKDVSSIEEGKIKIKQEIVNMDSMGVDFENMCSEIIVIDDDDENTNESSGDISEDNKSNVVLVIKRNSNKIKRIKPEIVSTNSQIPPLTETNEHLLPDVASELDSTVQINKENNIKTFKDTVDIKTEPSDNVESYDILIKNSDNESKITEIEHFDVESITEEDKVKANPDDDNDSRDTLELTDVEFKNICTDIIIIDDDDDFENKIRSGEMYEDGTSNNVLDSKNCNSDVKTEIPDMALRDASMVILTNLSTTESRSVDPKIKHFEQELKVPTNTENTKILQDTAHIKTEPTHNLDCELPQKCEDEIYKKLEQMFVFCEGKDKSSDETMATQQLIKLEPLNREESTQVSAQAVDTNSEQIVLNCESTVNKNVAPDFNVKHEPNENNICSQHITSQSLLGNQNSRQDDTINNLLLRITFLESKLKNMGTQVNDCPQDTNKITKNTCKITEEQTCNSSPLLDIKIKEAKEIPTNEKTEEVLDKESVKANIEEVSDEDLSRTLTPSHNEINIVINKEDEKEIKEIQKELGIDENEQTSTTKSRPNTPDDKESTFTGRILNMRHHEQELMRVLERRMHNYLHEEYKVIGLIHRGKFSNIFCCYDTQKRYYAAKVTRKFYHRKGKEQEKIFTNIQEGVARKDNGCLHIYNGFGLSLQWCLLYDYYSYNLKQVLKYKKKSFHIDDVQTLARQLISAVMFLKKNRIVHSNIKPTHVLLNSRHDTLKLCGFDEILNNNADMDVLPNIGTPSYRAPEIILGLSASYSIDVWATALVIYEMAAKKILFPGMFNNVILDKQMTMLGKMPLELLMMSMFKYQHFDGKLFMRRSGARGEIITYIPPKEFKKTKLLRTNLIYAHKIYWGSDLYGRDRIVKELEKTERLHDLLDNMLNMDPYSRYDIESAAENDFFKF